MADILIISFFILGYIAIIFEYPLKINKAAVAITTAVFCWTVFFTTSSDTLADNLKFLAEKFSDVSQILFFLLGAMTIVELIDSHKGFKAITELIQTRSKLWLLWLVSFVTFFLSAILDNLTTTILMISLMRKLIPKSSKERLVFLVMVVIAANAGGAWTPIGDVTTTMLWINNKITTLQVMSSLFVPSLIAMLIPLFIYSYKIRGVFGHTEDEIPVDVQEPWARLVFILGVSGLVLVPIFKWSTGLPPYMGMLVALGVVWLVTDIIHHKHSERSHLRVPHVLTKVDVSSILFFLGILLSVDALEAAGLLKVAAEKLDALTSNQSIIATIIGLGSAIIDNVPLVAATMGMYDLAVFPTDSMLWLLIAFAAGTGGSILIIGSASGVAMMGLEKVDFVSYLKKGAIPALLGFLGGMLCLILF